MIGACIVFRFIPVGAGAKIGGEVFCPPGHGKEPLTDLPIRSQIEHGGCGFGRDIHKLDCALLEAVFLFEFCQVRADFCNTRTGDGLGNHDGVGLCGHHVYEILLPEFTVERIHAHQDCLAVIRFAGLQIVNGAFSGGGLVVEGDGVFQIKNERVSSRASSFSKFAVAVCRNE